MFRIAICCLLVVSFQRTVSADSLQLPLQGYFHPGHAMPVQWNATGSSPIELSGEGAVTSLVMLPGPSHGIFPFLMLNSTAQTIHWQSSDFALHPLQESDRLVATTLTDESIASHLFLSHSTYVIDLDPTQLRLGPPMAWETLDALVIDYPTLSRIPLATRQLLLAAGVILAVVSPDAPDRQFRWTQSGRAWIAGSSLTIPASINPDAFNPILGWPAGRSVVFRWRVVQLAIIFSLLAGGLALWKSRRMPLAMIALCLMAMGVLAWDNRGQSPVARAGGTIYLDAQSVAVADQWLYQSSHRDASFALSALGLIHPFASDSSYLNPQDLKLTCDDQGQPVSLTGSLHADHTLAILIRQIAPVFTPQSITVDSPLHRLIQPSIYPHCTILGQSRAQSSTAGQTVVWPAVIARTNSQK